MTTATSSCVRFDPVDVRADTVVIVAMGPSVQEVDLRVIPESAHVIAVKRAIYRIPRADSWITVDANGRTRGTTMLHPPRREVTYWAAVPPDFGTPGAMRFAHRPPPEPGIRWLRRVDGGPTGRPRLAEDPSEIHSGNSAYGALGLAYHMRPRRIVLLGVDLTQQTYGLETGRPRGSLAHVPALFDSAREQLRARGIRVVSASHHGRLRCFPIKPWREALEWLESA